MSAPAAVLLTLGGLIQSSSTAPGGNTRTTDPHPSKSMVVGLVASAMGRERGADLSDLAALEFGVRVDYAGVGEVEDYHTAKMYKKVQRDGQTGQLVPSTRKDDEKTLVTKRRYRSEAVYVAALSGDPELIGRIHEALLRPTYAPYLGRRSAIPTVPIYSARSTVLTGSVMEVLAAADWAAPKYVKAKYRYAEGEPLNLAVFRDADPGTRPMAYVRDHPLGGRSFRDRGVVRNTVTLTYDASGERWNRYRPTEGIVPPAYRVSDDLPEPVADAPAAGFDPFALL